MSYDVERTAISHTPVTLVVMTLDWCTRTFGSAPCTGTGSPCYNTYTTCKDRVNYARGTKDYKFTSSRAPIPFFAGERPYVRDVDWLPTEIKRSIAVTGRVTIKFIDEPDTDIGIDPYVAVRPSVQGTFWKKFIARNKNYGGRPISIYHGFLGLTEADFVLRWTGVIESIQIADAEVKLTAVDYLRKLADVYVPPKLDIKLVVDLGSSQTLATVSSTDNLDASGYILIDEEIIAYTSKNDETHVLSGCERGMFGTSPANHSKDTKVQKVRYFSPDLGFTHLQTLLTTDAGLSASVLDADAWSLWADWPGDDILFSAVLTEPRKLDDVFFELVDIMDCKCWVNESGKITIRRNIPNAPDRSYKSLPADTAVIAGSQSVKLNDDERVTRVIIYSDHRLLTETGEAKNYGRVDIAIDADAESAAEYGDVKAKTIYSSWVRSGYIQEETFAIHMKNLASRILMRKRDVMPTVQVKTTLKEANIVTGDYTLFSSGCIENADGTDITAWPAEVVKRDEIDNAIQYTLELMRQEKVGFIADDSCPDFDAASDADKEYGYITDNAGLINGAPGYYIW